ncbi:MAG: hypothetical protein K9J79_07670 [Desulfobacteraceae bacterium]|nr:hypothetical protein [Desulfobacteraceae bacterium]
MVTTNHKSTSLHNSMAYSPEFCKSEKKYHNRPFVKIFWTGGWDSTFRIILLAETEVVIQPYYIRDNRKSEQNELNAIKAITKDLRATSSVRCSINDIIIYSVEDIGEDYSITEAYNRLLKKKFMGSQYDWLARFAKRNKEVELCIHKDDKAHDIINTFGVLEKKHNDIIGGYFVLDKSKSTRDLEEVFGNFRFPIMNESKVSMQKEAKRLGYNSIMNKTWFCFTPIGNEPCGVCNPCQYAIEEGMAFRFSDAALKRYRVGKLKNRTKALLMKSGLFSIIKKIAGK